MARQTRTRTRDTRHALRIHDACQGVFRFTGEVYFLLFGTGLPVFFSSSKKRNPTLPKPAGEASKLFFDVTER
jgi:hypothetical protein